ncbi:hypothetical protein OR606_03610 [Aeromonas hydrophila]|uniref:hypothetical protein n=1 Tax=Aeromonas hydrophila TaxID=644 RepID=UPI00224CC934|nr:hypothetical protein [Aeromonas hydrophila]MCX4039289.1 hypothetical protein [Aeromonas hydrophila]
MAIILVKNKKNTSHKTPPSGYTSWLDFWEQKKERGANICERVGCEETNNLVGAHVIISGEGGKEYILPLCKGSKCNHTTNEDEFKAWDSDLVPVT